MLTDPCQPIRSENVEKPCSIRLFGTLTIQDKKPKGCTYEVAPEQKARVTYDNILRLCDDPDVRDPIKYLREREIVHYQRFADANLPHSNRFFELLKHEFYKKRTHNKSLSQPNRGDRLLCFGTLGIRYHLAVKVR